MSAFVTLDTISTRFSNQRVVNLTRLYGIATHFPSKGGGGGRGGGGGVVGGGGGGVGGGRGGEGGAAKRRQRNAGSETTSWMSGGEVSKS